MKKSYIAPAVIEYGTIAENTFVTPAASRKYGVPVGNEPALGDGNYRCSPLAGMYSMDTGKPGGKNYLVLQCDKFGEYSHS